MLLIVFLSADRSVRGSHFRTCGTTNRQCYSFDDRGP